MAGKSRRVASRQGELSRRRKRGQRGPTGVPVAATQPQAQQNGGTAAVTVEAAESATSTATTQARATNTQAAAGAAERPAQQPATQAQARGPRTRGERPAAYNYVGAELRRIGVLSTLVVAALIVIAVVL